MKKPGSAKIRRVDKGRLLRARVRELERELRLCKSHEKSVRAAEAKYCAILSALNDVILIHDGRTGEIEEGVCKTAKLGGYRLEELMREGMGKLISAPPPYTFERMREKIVKALKGQPQSFEWPANAKDGRPIWLEVNLKSATIGRKRCVLSVIRDITERKRTQESIRESEEHYRSLFESCPDGISICTLDGKYLDANKAYEQMVGYNLAELRRMNFRDITPSEYHAPEDRFISAEVLKGKTAVLEKECVSKSGRRFPVSVTGCAIRDDDGRPVRLAAFVKDITDRKEAEKQAREHEAELARVLRLSTMGEMVAELAHELNQPFCAILNYAEGCSRSIGTKKADTAEAGEGMKLIAAQAERAGQIIRRIRGFVHKGGPQRTESDLNEVIREAVKLLMPEVRSPALTVKLELADDLPRILVDPIQIEQVALNLIRNGLEAMKDVTSTRNALIVRTARRGSDWVEVAVCDSGHGIAEKEIPKVFEAFYTTRPHGMGLGLTIGRSIVESHGGRLWAERNVDRGMTFRFTLPVSEESN